MEILHPDGFREVLRIKTPKTEAEIAKVINPILGEAWSVLQPVVQGEVRTLFYNGQGDLNAWAMGYTGLPVYGLAVFFPDISLYS